MQVHLLEVPEGAGVRGKALNCLFSVSTTNNLRSHYNS